MKDLEETNKHKCDHCKQTFSGKFQLKKHVDRIHLKVPNQIVCNTCGKTFANNWNLKVHNEMVHEKTTHSECPICNKVFASGDKYFLKHIEKHETEDLPEEEKHQILIDRNGQCPICYKVFSGKEYVNLHIKSVHDETQKVQCDLCNKVLSCSSAE